MRVNTINTINIFFWAFASLFSSQSLAMESLTPSQIAYLRDKEYPEQEPVEYSEERKELYKKWLNDKERKLQEINFAMQNENISNAVEYHSFHWKIIKLCTAYFSECDSMKADFRLYRGHAYYALGFVNDAIEDYKMSLSFARFQSFSLLEPLKGLEKAYGCLGDKEKADYFKSMIDSNK